MPAPVITFLSDYGLADEFVGVCHAVIARVCPRARVIDLTHGIPRHDVRAGALALADALAYLPVGVHLAVVDPGVGSARRAIALRCADGRRFVGPDNGLLSVAARAAGGIEEAVDIGDSRFCLRPVSATFHGRDIFAPVAAALASGATLPDAGEPCDPASVAALELPAAGVRDGVLISHVRYVDGFGNVGLDARGGLDAAAVVVALPDGSEHRARRARAFADGEPGELLLYEDARSRLALAVCDGDAAALLGVAADDELRIRPA
ncbi:MAG: SAM hydrolase/SAM-dependent halogenase family protein [Actinocrinis sp.]